MNVLVTGGAGFIGSHVADELLAAGHRVVIVDDLNTGHRHNVPADATFYEADICDEAKMAEIFEREQIEAVSHQAARANVRASMADPLTYARTNVLGTLVILELARKRQCHKIVFASTGGAVYGEGYTPDGSKLPFTEKTWPQPKDNYGANKLSMEFHLDLYYANYGLKYTTLRYPNVYGPRQDSRGEAGVVAIFAGAMLEGRPIKINGDGKQQRDFCYVGDVARANRMALESDVTGIFNVGTGIPTDINTIFATLRDATGYDQDAEHLPPAVGEVRATYLDSSKIKAALGWQAEVPLDEGIRRVVAWMRASSLRV
ncbi:MAG: NAD-dependent epimerase/dehydratase family protein [Caldilineaceae bacterium]|nr:NAD-dependent epimerase/dehydratase family protein [Caldilineaceae bacterium]MCB0122049.1 NAD-dependent epimerase/dehydratase family protein [Caldilineaceae bacterium]